MTRGLRSLPDLELRSLLVEWKRWRRRVLTSETMRLRQERFDEATTYIDAIEHELALRDPQGRHRLRQHAALALRQVSEVPVVSLEAYRRARQRLAELKTPRAH